MQLVFLFFGIVNLLFNKEKLEKNWDVILGTSGVILLLCWRGVALRYTKLLSY